MPKATVNIDSKRFELKTCPEGYVELMAMPYGKKLFRQQMASAMRFSGGGKGKNFEGEMDLTNAKVIEYEFKECITDHNLEKEDGKPLDFTKARDVNALDPRIGEEISTQISKMNNFEDDEDESGNS